MKNLIEYRLKVVQQRSAGPEPGLPAGPPWRPMLLIFFFFCCLWLGISFFESSVHVVSEQFSCGVIQTSGREPISFCSVSSPCSARSDPCLYILHSTPRAACFPGDCLLASVRASPQAHTEANHHEVEDRLFRLHKNRVWWSHIVQHLQSLITGIFL